MGSPQHRQHFLEPLPFEDCWSVFAQHAFEDGNMNENENLVNIGKDIVRKCKGLPLSARVLGGLLRGKKGEFEWKDVLDSECWWEDNQIYPSLWLSYHRLPSYLKPCFAYCSIFPKDYIFGKDELVLLWIAEGLVQPGRENRQLEDIGREYFNELLSRSLFQLLSVDGNKKSFMMHDLINGLAQKISGSLCFRLEKKLEDPEKSKSLGRARYSTFCQGKSDNKKKFESFIEGNRLRTFLPSSFRDGNYSLEANVLFLFSKLRCLRSLSLRYYNVNLPDSVGDMKHLRYLDLSFTNIETLPDWVQNLYNLQTLILRECKKLTSLPKNMGNLINLRFFDVTNADLLTEMPLGIGNMKSLHMLSNFIVTKDKGSRIKELGELRHIEETLCISGLHNITDHRDAKGARIIEKQHLSKLIMDYDANSDAMPNDKVERVLDMLRPHNNIKELTIRGYHGIKFPTWLSDPLFTNMVHIEINDCRNCSDLPPIGNLKSLKKLYIQGMSSVKCVGREFYGLRNQKPFPSLETLSFKDMPEWENWFAFGVKDKIQPFANVRQLYIKGCPRLVSLFSEEIDGESGERQQEREAGQSFIRRLELLQIEDCVKLEKLDKIQPFANVNQLLVIKCPNLSAQLPSNLPNLVVLEIRNSGVQFKSLDYPSVTSFIVDDIKLPFSPSEPNNINSPCSSVIKNVSVPDTLCTMAIKLMEIARISELENLPQWLTYYLTSLEQLKIHSCMELKKLLLQNQLPGLQHLSIKLCPKLVSLFYKEESEVVDSFTSKLESLSIQECKKLEKLSRGLHMLTCLVDLFIEGCHKLVSFPEFPRTLRSLSISNCKALDTPLPCWKSDRNLQNLAVYQCPSLTGLLSSSCSSENTIRTDALPSSLKSLKILDCEKLEVLVDGNDENEIHCPSLKLIYIYNCGKLRKLPDISFDDSFRELTQLILRGCGDLHKNFPGRWSNAVKKLTEVSYGSGEMLSEFSYIQKEVGFITNLAPLRELEIDGPTHVVREGKTEGELVIVSLPLKKNKKWRYRTSQIQRLLERT